MNILEFATKYCADIVEKANKRTEMFDLSGFSYDEIITDLDGAKIPVVNTENYQIPIADILEMNRTEFAKVWGNVECLEAYDTYVSTLIILEGEEVLNVIRNKLRTEQEKLSAYEDVLEYFQ